MPSRRYFSLPINADEGFPQAFRLTFNEQSYQMLLYVNCAAALLDDEDAMLQLPIPRAFLVLRVLRETPSGTTAIFQRKVIPYLEYEAAELALLFTEMRVARRNLNGVGAFGSQVLGGIAAR